MTNKPEISVIVPVYGVEPYLEECLRSLTGQTFRNVEIILVDDGSPDRCPGICDRWAAFDRRIKVIHQDNRGLSAARNAGLDIAAGDYIMFADSDDIALPGFFEIPLARARAADADIIVFGYADTDQNGIPSRFQSTNARPVYAGRTKALCWLAEGRIRDYVWDKLWRRELFDTVRFPVGEKWEDQLTTYLLFDRASRFVILPDLLYHYRKRPGALSREDPRTALAIVADHRNTEYEYLIKHCPPAGRKMELTAAKTELQYLITDFPSRSAGYRKIRKRLLSRNITIKRGGLKLWTRIQLVRISPALLTAVTMLRRKALKIGRRFKNERKQTTG